jgi:hypothetical protein
MKNNKGKWFIMVGIDKRYLFHVTDLCENCKQYHCTVYEDGIKIITSYKANEFFFETLNELSEEEAFSEIL